jgi:hypothetical protein
VEPGLGVVRFSEVMRWASGHGRVLRFGVSVQACRIAMVCEISSACAEGSDSSGGVEQAGRLLA